MHPKGCIVTINRVSTRRLRGCEAAGHLGKTAPLERDNNRGG